MAKRQFFGTDGIRGQVGQHPITPEFILKLGWAAGCVLGDGATDSKILIGKDTRISGYMFESALEAGLSAAGMNIQLLGPMPTPAIAYLTRTHRAKAGIVISASHNLYTDNGIKFFSAEGTKLPDHVELAIEAQLAKPLTMVASENLGKAARMDDAAGRYIEFCKSSIPSTISLRGLKIVVDCANGATYHIAPHVFAELGAEVIELSVNPDGFNINQNCGSTDAALLKRIVLAEAADVGIALDGDGDRLLMIDREGNILDGDDILYIIAKYRLHSPNQGVVGTVMSNQGLAFALARLGLPFIRTAVGDRHVINELQQRGWWLGGEPSGHIVWLPANTTGDGIISALQVLASMVMTSQSLVELKADLQKMPQILENIPSSLDALKENKVKVAIAEVEAQLAPQGRVVVRASGTEPLVRIMLEGENMQQIRQLTQQLADTIRCASAVSTANI